MACLKEVVVLMGQSGTPHEICSGINNGVTVRDGFWTGLCFSDDTTLRMGAVILIDRLDLIS